MPLRDHFRSPINDRHSWDSLHGGWPTSIYAVACRGTIPRRRWLLEGWRRPLTIGQPLPTLPLWLTEDFHISLDLEPSYEESCRALRIE